MTDAEYWEQWRVLQQAATDAAREHYEPRLQPNTPKKAN
jgi:hypothetical protein